MAETKRYDVSGKPNGGRVYPEGTILKLTDAQAKAMGLTSSDLSKMKTTADDAEHARSYEEALTRQDEMRSAEVEAANASTADATADATASTRKRTPRS